MGVMQYLQGVASCAVSQKVVAGCTVLVQSRWVVEVRPDAALQSTMTLKWSAGYGIIPPSPWLARPRRLTDGACWPGLTPPPVPSRVQHTRATFPPSEAEAHGKGKPRTQTQTIRARQKEGLTMTLTTTTTTISLHPTPQSPLP